MTNKFEYTNIKCLIKKTGPIIVFSIIAPLCDMMFDMKLIFHVYLAKHPIFASMLLGG